MTAVAWSAIGLLATTLFFFAGQQTLAMRGLGAKIDGLGARLDGLGARLDDLGARLDAKIDALGARLDARIDALAVRVDANTTETMRLSRRLEEHINRHAG